MLQDLPQGVTVDAVKCLLEVDEIDKKGDIPLHALLNDVSESKYLVDTPSSLSKASLFFPKSIFDGTFDSVQDHSTEDFAGNGEECDTTPGVAFLEVPFLGNLYYETPCPIVVNTFCVPDVPKKTF